VYEARRLVPNEASPRSGRCLAGVALVLTGRDRIQAGKVKLLTSCPACPQGLAKCADDTGPATDYILVERIGRILGEGWSEDSLQQVKNDGIERVPLNPRAIARGTVLGEACRGQRQLLRGEALRLHPVQQEKPRVVEHQALMRRARPPIPADPAIARRLPSRRPEADGPQHAAVVADEVEAALGLGRVPVRYGFEVPIDRRRITSACSMACWAASYMADARKSVMVRPSISAARLSMAYSGPSVRGLSVLHTRPVARVRLGSGSRRAERL
jgi:hypothetical protein